MAVLVFAIPLWTAITEAIITEAVISAFTYAAGSFIAYKAGTYVSQKMNNEQTKDTRLKSCSSDVELNARGDLPSRGAPNSSAYVDRGDGSGTIRDYGSDGRAKTDYDFGHDHETGDPHAHDWDWSAKKRRQDGRPLKDGE